MKILLVLLLVVSCTRKYQTYHTIDKNNFTFGDDSEQNLVTKKLYPGKKEVKSYCAGQIFWNNNAKKETEQQINQIIRFTCDESNYLLNSKITETWWTTIFYSRACIEIETYCPRTLKSPQ